MPDNRRTLDGITQTCTDRRQAGERLAKLNECLLSFGVDPQENINRLVALCGHELGAACALYNRLEDGKLSAWGQWNVPADFNPVDTRNGHICYEVIRSGRTEACVIRNLPETAFARTDPNVLRYGLQTYVGKPVSFGKAFVGSLCVLYAEDRVPSQEDSEFLGIVASAIGVEERRKGAEAALRGRTEQLEAVRVVSEEIARELNLTTLLGLIIDRALGLVDAPAGVIYLWDRETEVLVPRAWLGYGDWISEVRLHLGEGVTGVAAQRQEGMIVNDYRSSPYALPFLQERMGPIAALVEPLLYRGHLLGAITANHIATHRGFTEKDQRILRLLAAQAAIAIENARLYRQVQEHAGTLERRVEERTRALEEVQAELVQSAKLAAVGTLAAGVVHELNQPLTIIRGYAQWLMGEEGITEAARAALDHIQSQAGRMARIVNHLRDFSRQTKGTYEPVALNEVVEAAFLMLRQQLRARGIEVVLALDPALPAVRGDRFQLEQVFINLITNARDAMQPRGGGRLTVTTRAVNDWVEVAVADTGPGVPADLRDRIFDPFFTTKEIGEGTGLGLSISYGIMREHGGEIRVADRPEGGAEFVVRLPVPPLAGAGAE